MWTDSRGAVDHALAEFARDTVAGSISQRLPQERRHFRYTAPLPERKRRDARRCLDKQR